MNSVILLAHVFFGMACIVAVIWLFVDVLHANDRNQARIRLVSRLAAAAMWCAFLVGGYWYVVSYKADKAIILKGPWPFAHSFFMETKEHLVIMMLLVATYLPIATANNLAENKDARRVVLWAAALCALLGLAMDGEGGLIAMGVKMGLLGK
jgi:hypothetical protein